MSKGAVVKWMNLSSNVPKSWRSEGRKHTIQQTPDAGKSAFRRSIFGPSWTDADNTSETRRKERENSVLTLLIVCGFCRSKRLFIIHHDVFPLQVSACRLLRYLPLSGLNPSPPQPPCHPHPLAQSSVYRRARRCRQQTWWQYRGTAPRLSCFSYNLLNSD